MRFDEFAYADECNDEKSFYNYFDNTREYEDWMGEE